MPRAKSLSVKPKSRSRTRTVSAPRAKSLSAKPKPRSVTPKPFKAWEPNNLNLRNGQQLVNLRNSRSEPPVVIRFCDLPNDILHKIIRMVYDSYLTVPRKYFTKRLNMEKLTKTLEKITDENRFAITLNNYRNSEKRLSLRNISPKFKVLLEPYTHATRKRDCSFVLPEFMRKNCADKDKEDLMQATKTRVMSSMYRPKSMF